MQTIDQLIIERRTIDHFKPEIPAKDIIIDAIDKACFVPNHHLTQPWSFYILNNEMIKQIVHLNADLVEQNKGSEAAKNKIDRWSKIPGWLVVTCNRSSDTVQNQEDYAACCCHIYALSLLLWDKGIGVKWTTGTITREDVFYDICWIDKTLQSVVGLIWYGYPDKIPAPQQRRNVNESITVF